MKLRSLGRISYTSRILSLLFALLLVFSTAVPALAEDVLPADPGEEETVEDPPACETTGEHQFLSYSYAGNGKHVSVCELCKKEFENDCIYAEDAAVCNNDGTHGFVCTLCAGVKNVPCELAVETVLPTQTEAGIIKRSCAVCAYTVEEALIPEGERPQSSLSGDADCDGGVSAADARLILRVAVSLEDLNPEVLPYADMDHDGAISAADARLALRSSVDLEKDVRHEFVSELKKDNTCTEAGALDYHCTYCGLNVTLVIPAAGHSLKETDRVPATCTEKGSVSYVCEVCGFKQEKSLSATGHKWVDATAKEPKHCSVCNEIVKGWTQLQNGDWHYTDNDGKVPAGKAVVYATFKKVTGYWYLENGILQEQKRTGVSIGGTDWNVSNGAAKKVETEADRTLFRAFGEVEKATTPDMTKEQKLRACFDYTKTHYAESRPRTPHYQGMDWPVIYANDMFVRGTGNCFSYAAAFGYLAKAIGYENVYCCHSGGHGWTEIDGLVYDPEWSKGHTQYNYFGLSYDTRTDVRYKEAISAGLPWMHVKI